MFSPGSASFTPGWKRSFQQKKSWEGIRNSVVLAVFPPLIVFPDHCFQDVRFLMVRPTTWCPNVCRSPFSTVPYFILFQVPKRWKNEEAEASERREKGRRCWKGGNTTRKFHIIFISQKATINCKPDNLLDKRTTIHQFLKTSGFDKLVVDQSSTPSWNWPIGVLREKLHVLAIPRFEIDGQRRKMCRIGKTHNKSVDTALNSRFLPRAVISISGTLTSRPTVRTRGSEHTHIPHLQKILLLPKPHKYSFTYYKCICNEIQQHNHTSTHWKKSHFKSTSKMFPQFLD